MVAITVCVTVFSHCTEITAKDKKGQKNPCGNEMQFISTFHTSLPALVMPHFIEVTHHGK